MNEATHPVSPVAGVVTVGLRLEVLHLLFLVRLVYQLP